MNGVRSFTEQRIRWSIPLCKTPLTRVTHFIHLRKGECFAIQSLTFHLFDTANIYR